MGKIPGGDLMTQQSANHGSFISALQFGMLAAGMTSISNHALAVTYLLKAGGRDAWLAGFLALPVTLLAVWAMIALSRMYPGKSLVQYLPEVAGPLFGRILAASYILYFFGSSIFTLRRTTDWIVDSLLPESPPTVLAALYLTACLAAAAGGIEVLARTNQFTLPLLTAVGMFVSFATAPSKNYGFLLPILADGPEPALRSAWVALGIFGELCILGMIIHFVRGTQRILKPALLAVLYSVITMTGPLTGAIATLGHRQGANMPYPTFQQWLMISFARFLERTDLLVAHQWLVGAYVRTGLLLLAVTMGLRQLFGRGRPSWILGMSGVIVFTLSISLFRSTLAFDAFVSTLYLPTGAILGIVVPVFLWVIAVLRRMVAGGGVRGGANHKA